MAVDVITRNGVINAAGGLDIDFRTTGSQNWTVQQVTTLAPTVGGSATCKLLLNGAFIAVMVPQFGVAAGEPYIPLRSGSKMTVRYAAAVVGAPVEATIVYDDGTDQ